MRNWKLLVVALAAAAVLPASALADGTTGQDRANGARACKALQTSMGSTFGDKYATFGACVSEWTQTAHAARHSALKACKAQGKRGQALKSCTTLRTNSTVATKQRATTNASKTCAAERTALGDEAFAVKYGQNENDANAFGKCVSALASSNGTANRAQVFTVTFGQIGTSGASGKATLVLKGTQLFVKINATGLEAGKEHMAHIHGVTSGNTGCTGDAGAILLPLTPYSTANNGGNLSFMNTFTIDPAALGSLDRLTINIHGKTVNGAYNAGTIVACGEIEPR